MYVNDAIILFLFLTQIGQGDFLILINYMIFVQPLIEDSYKKAHHIGYNAMSNLGLHCLHIQQKK